MIDKELSELKKDIPNYNIDEYKNGVFKKYNDLKELPSKKPLIPSKYVFASLLIILISCFTVALLINNKSIKVNAYESDRDLLSRVVYNASIQKNESYEVSHISKDKKFSNNFYYTAFKIHKSFGFEVTFDFVMEPYFNDYIIGEEVFVVIALLEFTSDGWANNSFLQKMIIFTYKDQVVGFMSPQFTSSLYGDFNELTYSSDETVKTLYTFGSYIFLTKDAIVKYYEKDDILYDFEFEEYENGTFNLFVESNDAECNLAVNEKTLTELSYDIVIELLKSSYIEKIEVMVTIVRFDDINEKKIYIECDEYPSIESVYYRYAILDLGDNIVERNQLSVGDRIMIYYYNRYENYQPKDLTVDNIILYR